MCLNHSISDYFAIIMLMYADDSTKIRAAFWAGTPLKETLIFVESFAFVP